MFNFFIGKYILQIHSTWGGAKVWYSFETAVCTICWNVSSSGHLTTCKIYKVYGNSSSRIYAYQIS